MFRRRSGYGGQDGRTRPARPTWRTSHPPATLARSDYGLGSDAGGWLALVMAGIKNDKVTAATAGMPFLSDMGRLHHHAGSSLRNLIVAEGSDATIPCYAGVNFARFIKCPIIVSVGYCDGSCCPSSVYAAYNVIPSTDKIIYAFPLAGHGRPTEYRAAVNAFLKDKLRK